MWSGMKKGVFGLVFLTLVCGSSAGAATISIRADYWPPYNADPGTAKKGYMIEILQEIFAPLGHTIDYQMLSWDESLAAVEKGEFDAVVGASHDDAPEFVFPKESMGNSGTGLFVKRGSTWTFKGMSSLEKVRLGVIEAYSYSEEIDAYIADHRGSDRIVEVSGDNALPELIGMLRAGKVDVVAEDPSVMVFNLLDQKIPVSELVAINLTAEKVPLYVAFSPAKKSSKEYARQFDEGLRTLRKNGKLQQILYRYGLKDWSL